MSKFNFSPYYSDEEWDALKGIAKIKYPNKKINVGLSYMLRDNILKTFGKENCIPCGEEKEKKRRKHFEIDLPDHVIKVINCKSSKLKIHPTTLILRSIINPQLNDFVPEDSDAI